MAKAKTKKPARWYKKSAGAPVAGAKWRKGYTKKDGTRVKGCWTKPAAKSSRRKVTKRKSVKRRNPTVRKIACAERVTPPKGYKPGHKKYMILTPAKRVHKSFAKKADAVAALNAIRSRKSYKGGYSLIVLVKSAAKKKAAPKKAVKKTTKRRTTTTRKTTTKRKKATTRRRKKNTGFKSTVRRVRRRR